MQQKWIPLSRHQRAIWLEALLYPDRPIFNIGTYVLLDGIPDVSTLENAIQRIIDQHDALRMQVVQNGAEPNVIFNDSFDFELKTTQHASQEAAVLWMEQDFVTPISVNAEQLFDIQLVQFQDQAYLYLKHHHIYIDGWGRGKLVQAIADQYNALLTSDKTENRTSYQEFLESTNQDTNQESEMFWQSVFDETFERTALFDPISNEINLPSERFVSKWKSPSFYNNFDQKEQFYFQLAALATTLAITKNQKEITIGIPLLNRFDETALETIGYYVGLIPLRIQIPEDVPFEELVNNVKESFRATRNHRDLSIQEINSAIGMQTTDFHQAYDVVFSFEPHNHNCVFGKHTSIEAGTFSSDFEQNPLVIHAQQFIESDRVDFVWDHNLKYLDRVNVAQLSEQFERVLESANKHPQKRLSELDLLETTEQKQLEKFTKGRIQKLKYDSIYQWIEQNPNSNSEDPILFDEKHSYTCSEVRNEAIRLASELQNLDVSEGSHIAIHMKRSADVVIAITSCVFAGLPYIYIDPELGSERKQRILNDASVAGAIVQKQEDLDMTQIQLWSDHSHWNWTPPTTKADDPLYALFTSGSTGTPKGVSIPQRGIVNLIQELESSFFVDPSEKSRLALVSSFTFDASVQFIFAHLCLGYPLHIVPETARKDGRELANFCATNSITHIDGIPSHLTSLYLRNQSPPKNFSVKHYLIGGEAMAKEQIQKFTNWIDTPVHITNAYGPTECSVDATLFRLNESVLESDGEIPIGRPVSNSEIHILDSRGIPVPLGSKGEIHIGGIGLALKYLNAPEDNQTSFLEHPIYGRLYKTGDLGAWREDGNLLCFGRVDHQVKIRGFRIELGEIEACLKRISEIDEACVIVKGQGHTQSLVAFVQTSVTLNENRINVALLESLPEYMVPNAYHQLEVFPETASGKIDRKKIEQLEIDQGEVSSIQPETDTEKEVTVIVSGLLDIEFPDVTKSFFSLGGDSLSLVYLITELEEAFGLELPIHQMADRNAIREIATFLDHKIEQEAPEIDLWEAVHKTMDWSFPKQMPPSSKKNNALLTGATGFVGAFLLKELLDNFDKVYCLVRSSSELHAHLRLKAAMEQYQLDVNTSDPKIRYIFGDLSQPQLGLSDSKWTELSTDISTIYHSGAEVHFLKNAEAMHATNVGGTSELLRLACNETLKSMHFVSTVGIFSELNGELHETHDISTQIHTGKKGYETTKWIAEGCVVRAKEAGIPCSVYRLARVTGHTTTGTPNFDDFFHRFLLGCIDLGLFPESLINSDTDLTPIDTTVKGIVSLSKEKSDTFHLINPNRMHYQELLYALEKEGSPLEVVPTDQFLKIAIATCRTADHPLYTIMPILKQKLWFSVDSKRFGLENTLMQLKNEGIQWPRATDLLDIYTKRWIGETKKLWDKMNIKTQ